MPLDITSSCGASGYGEVARANFAQIEARLTVVEHVVYPIGVFANATKPVLPNPLYPKGVMIFNTDDNAPNFSNGTYWVDAMGVATLP
jgi:hypothetical protein